MNEWNLGGLRNEKAPPATLTDPGEAADLVRHLVATELNETALGSDDVDLLLLKDSPSCPVMQAQWAVLEEMLATGKTRAIGTYNYCESALRCILANATVQPALNYIMRHVGMGPDAMGLLALNDELGIKTATYGALGEPSALTELLADPTLRRIAVAHGRSVAAVALRWNLQAGYAVSNRPTADYNNVVNSASCTDNCSAAIGDMVSEFEWSLSAADVRELDALTFSTWPQPPAYYASAGCLGPNGTFSVIAKPNASACAMRPSISSWC